MSPPPAGTAATSAPPDQAVADFEEIYRANVAGITAFFARRCGEPQAVADLTSETFVQAIASLGSFDPRRGSARAWVFGIARHVYARHCAQAANGNHTIAALAGHRELEHDEIEELAARIDACASTASRCGSAPPGAPRTQTAAAGRPSWGAPHLPAPA